MSMISAGCLFPSFDGFDQEGREDRGKAGDDKTSPSSGTSSLPASPLSSDAGGGAAREAGEDESRRSTTFLCDGRRCALGTQVCCGGVVSIKCEAAANASSCVGGYVRCSDNENCSGGQTCCFNEASTNGELGSCQTKCEGQNKFVACDPSIDPPHCPSGMKCTGRWGRGLPFCQ